MNRGMNALDRFDRAVTAWMGRHAIQILRLALAIIYIWFGALKLFGASPVADLVASMAPMFPPDVIVPLMGAWEIVIGLGLLFRFALRLTLLFMFVQLAGTFLTLIVQPQIAFQGRNPLALTQTGEFVIKNLVLLSAGIVIGSTVRREGERIATRPSAQPGP
jgi:uncharacterized membrane protein YkgB